LGRIEKVNSYLNTPSPEAKKMEAGINLLSNQGINHQPWNGLVKEIGGPKEVWGKETTKALIKKLGFQ